MERTPKLLDQWGRAYDRDSWHNWPPQSNPDTTEESQYFDFSTNPQVVAGLQYSDVSHLFVSARGLTDEQNGAYFPPQLFFTTPSLASDEILDLVAWQFDEEFEGGFQEVIRSIDTPCKINGHQVVEFEWYIRKQEPFKGNAFVKRAWARDPSKYRYNYEGKSGIFLDDGYGTFKLLKPIQFQSYAYNPLYNNPYGQSINLPLKPWIETFNKIFGYWRHALEKAGLGSWTASFPNAWMANDAVSKRNLVILEEKLKLVAAGTYSMFPEGAIIQNQKLAMEAQGFLDWYNSFCEVVSLIYTGTTTALKESEFGSRAAKESTDVREKSQKEKFNAARVCNFWTWKFIPLLVDANFPDAAAYPTLQLIRPELITPTTPQNQDTTLTQETDGQEVTPDDEQNDPEARQETIVVKTKELQAPSPIGNSTNIIDRQSAMKFAKKISELQEPEQGVITKPPMAIPVSFSDFPATDPEPEIYTDVLTLAEQELSALQVKPYMDVQPAEAANTFTIKRLRSFSGGQALLEQLRDAIVPTLAAATEADAWKQYFAAALSIFEANETPLTPGIRDDLIISFRQARQNAFGRAIRKAALSDPDVVAMRLQTKEDPQVRFSHKVWNNVVLPKDSPLLERLAAPMDFGCRCNWLPVTVTEAAQFPLTEERDLPEIFPGGSYKYYAQPSERLPETQEAE